jgi:hypothetical protein
VAADWIKMRSGLDRTLPFMKIASSLCVTRDQLGFALYRLAGWFQEYGKYGKMRVEGSTIDSFLDMDGIYAELLSAGWLKKEGDVVMLAYFCDVSSARKSLGQSIREQILQGATCAHCGSADDLEIDHKTPISRGGSCEIENLQALCRPCNRSKGRKTMEEWQR